MSVSSGRSRSGDRFYTPPAVRRQLQLQQQQINHNKQNDNDNDKETQLRTKTSSLADCASSPATTPPHSVWAIDDGAANLSNLDRFLDHTTPLVPGHRFSKTSMRGWRTKEDEFRPYFVLGDLWESFQEWSAYGAGVPLLLDGSDYVMQYYVPYLSGIQLYIHPSMPTPTSRRPGEESDADSSRGSSDGSSDYETESGPNCFLQGVTSQQDLIIEATRQGIKGLSVSNKVSVHSSSDEGESASFPGALKFEHLERDTPYSREPLTNKMSILASRFPELSTYRSCDLSPASWMSVAWYPIYRIPMGPTLQNLDSCFLTFHSLSTPVNGPQYEWQCPYPSQPREVRQGFDMALKLSLPIFGLASYKFNAPFWEQQAGADVSPKACSLLRIADDWLQRLNVNHPDYRFFSSHKYWR